MLTGLRWFCFQWFSSVYFFISAASAKFNSAFQHFENFVRCFGRSVVPLIPLHAELHASEYVCFWHHWIYWIFTSIWWPDSLIESNAPDWWNIQFDYLTAECFFNLYSVKTYKISNLTLWFRCLSYNGSFLDVVHFFLTFVLFWFWKI